jgi:CBS domain-containing protein
VAHREGGTDIYELRIQDLMQQDLITAKPDLPIKRARELMKQNNINCLPVVEENALVGILTSNDL